MKEDKQEIEFLDYITLHPIPDKKEDMTDVDFAMKDIINVFVNKIDHNLTLMYIDILNYVVYQEEIDTLNRLTTLFLDTAELRVKERKDLTLNYWRETVDSLLNFQEKAILQGAGHISNKQMEEHVSAVYEQFDARRMALAAEEADIMDENELKALEETLTRRSE